jgi:hypothetical protein
LKRTKPPPEKIGFWHLLEWMVVSDFTFVMSRTLLALPALFSTQGLLACDLFPGLVG